MGSSGLWEQKGRIRPGSGAGAQACGRSLGSRHLGASVGATSEGHGAAGPTWFRKRVGEGWGWEAPGDKSVALLQGTCDQLPGLPPS